MTWLAFSVTYLTNPNPNPNVFSVHPCCNLYYCFFHCSFPLKIGAIEHRIHFPRASYGTKCNHVVVHTFSPSTSTSHVLVDHL